MRIADQITLRPISEATDDTSAISEVVINGIPSGKRVEGATLEAAVEWNSLYLLFLTDDIPYEEMLRVLLLDHQFDVVDAALIGNPYSTGAFSSLELCDPDTVRFRFIGGSPWTVQLRARRRIRLPFVSEPRGVHRPFRFSTQFIIRSNPAPQR